MFLHRDPPVRDPGILQRGGGASFVRDQLPPRGCSRRPSSLPPFVPSRGARAPLRPLRRHGRGDRLQPGHDDAVGAVRALLDAADGESFRRSVIRARDYRVQPV